MNYTSFRSLVDRAKQGLYKKACQEQENIQPSMQGVDKPIARVPYSQEDTIDNEQCNRSDTAEKTAELHQKILSKLASYRA